METIYSITPSDKFFILEARNKYCFIRKAEPNNRVISRLITITIELYFKTLKKLLLNDIK